MKTFERRRNVIDATMNGLFSGEPDTARQCIAGPTRYFIDGQEVSEADYMAAVPLMASASPR